MKKDIMFYYMELVEFLGVVLGPSYEIILYDLRREDKSVIAISNGHISGRNIDSSFDDDINQLLDNKNEEVYKANYKKPEKDKTLRASTLFIKNEYDEVVGLLCINFDDTNFKGLASQLMSLVHPNDLIPKNFFQKMDEVNLNLPSIASKDPENVEDTIDEIIGSVLNSLIKNDIPLDRLNKAERVSIVQELNNRGVFMLKGSVQYVADLLHSSEATIYRYLSKM